MQSKKIIIGVATVIILAFGFLYFRGSKLVSDSKLTTEQYNAKYKK